MMLTGAKSQPAAGGCDVSIVICTHGRIADLARTLASLAAVHIPSGWRGELILVENVRQDGAAELLARFQHPSLRPRYLFEPLAGKSRALNRALQAASGDVLLFTDDDVRFPVDWVRALCEPVRSGQADAVAGGVRLAPHLLRPWMNHTHRAWLASTADYLSPAAPSEMCGANMAVRRAVFERIRGFDPDIGPGRTAGGEESLFSWRAVQTGFRLVGRLDVEVEHHPDPTRLLYRSWRKTATLQGHTRGYLRYHWFARDLRFPLVRYAYLGLKLHLRRTLSRRYAPNDEGMPPWEMSYREDMAACLRFRQESRGPRKYTRLGTRQPPTSSLSVPCNQPG